MSFGDIPAEILQPNLKDKVLKPILNVRDASDVPNAKRDNIYSGFVSTEGLCCRMEWKKDGKVPCGCLVGLAGVK